SIADGYAESVGLASDDSDLERRYFVLASDGQYRSWVGGRDHESRLCLTEKCTARGQIRLVIQLNLRPEESNAICNTAFGKSHRKPTVAAIMSRRNETTCYALEQRFDRSSLNIQIASWWPPCDDIVNSRQIFASAELVGRFTEEHDRVTLARKCCTSRVRHIAQQSYHSDDGCRINRAGGTFII